MNTTLTKHYYQIMQHTTTVIVQTEWNKEGDYFKKLTMYDESYSTIITFDKTILLTENVQRHY